MTTRCGWARTEPMIIYHDTEWGVPVHDDRLLFEFLILEGAQAARCASIHESRRGEVSRGVIRGHKVVRLRTSSALRSSFFAQDDN